MAGIAQKSLIITLLSLPSLALAQPSVEDVQPLVSEAYGKAVPPQAICIASPPSDTFPGWAAIGVTQRRAGCRLLLLTKDGVSYSPEEASTTLKNDEWADLSQDEQSARLRAWSHELLMAFDHPLDHASGAASRRQGQWSVPLTFVQRVDSPGGTLYTETVYTFDDALRLTTAPRDEGLAFFTRLLSNPYRTQGIDREIVRASLYTKGKSIQACFDEAWQRDLELSGPVRIQMTIAGGSANALGVVAEDNSDEALGQCYVRVLRRVTFPESVEGTIIWSFTADRRTASP